MSGYIGTKSVTLSTTSASVGGDSSVGGDLTVDTNTLYVDSTKNRVGIVTSSPSAELEITGDALTTWEAASTKFIGSKFSTTYDLGMYMDTDNRKLSLSAKAGDSTGTIAFQTGLTPTERMRIDSSGNLLVATTSNPTTSATSQAFRIGPVSTGVQMILSGSETSSYAKVSFNNGNGQVGFISTSGSSTSYSTSSDHRLKENVTDVTDGITRVKQLEPKRFNFIADPDTTVDGFLAHEAQTVVPEAVTGTHNEVDDDGNAVMQGIDQAKLVPLLTAALKESIAKIEALEARVTALEGN